VIFKAGGCVFDHQLVIATVTDTARARKEMVRAILAIA
jgi:hypothetical protein